MRWIVVVLVLLAFISSVSAQDNDCEKLAKEYQQEHGGDLILVQPLKDNGAYDIGEYSGHWMNRAWNKINGNYYYDPQDKAYYFDVRSIERNFEDVWSKKAVVFDYNKGEVPFGIIWHY